MEWEEDFGRLEEEWKILYPENCGWLIPLRSYARLLYAWSGRMNLISPGDRDRLASRHLFPALRMAMVACILPNRTVIDFGSGAGLPGIPMKLVLPDSRFILVEGKRRRANFLREVVRRLDLVGVEVVNERWTGDSLGPVEKVELVVSRAVTGLEYLLEWVSPYLLPYGNILVTLPGRFKKQGVATPPLLLKRGWRWGEKTMWVGLARPSFSPGLSTLVNNLSVDKLKTG